ncbi:MAG: hypothetical protein A2W82_00770 [Sulfurimonas sp. RIFCSPLOWO2_12_36_12]|uniref:hypothetical protein n=1 Tax=Sulfurimonas sp. RIFCSPLOWO2_12_36_12 TaxID=1802253 RepID=UPI0008B9B180|nr:hypothetical protein [Sulfurimonas sp. RIFCSPLOWO2_12_36_12]OHE01196.1 MAG: hypothetical protein A2W82_00770 [Sulfurimonas sp. RIFCSPLOWO2_12_36_12]
MIKINWDDFKFFKQYSQNKSDNFEILLEFLKSHYKMTSPKEMYETMANDDTALLMLNKREINSLEDLEKRLYKNFSAK